MIEWTGSSCSTQTTHSTKQMKVTTGVALLVLLTLVSFSLAGYTGKYEDSYYDEEQEESHTLQAPANQQCKNDVLVLKQNIIRGYHSCNRKCRTNSCGNECLKRYQAGVVDVRRKQLSCNCIAHVSNCSAYCSYTYDTRAEAFRSTLNSCQKANSARACQFTYRTLMVQNLMWKANCLSRAGKYRFYKFE